MSNPKCVQKFYLKIWSWPDNVRTSIGDWGDFFQYLLPISFAFYSLAFFGWHAFLMFIGFFLLCVGTSTLLKGVFNNVRPREWKDHTDHPEISPDMDLEWSQKEGNSFCSGHTMASFAGALPWVLVNPWIGALAILLACFVGFSRMVVMAHWLRDVLMSIVLSSLYFGLIYFWI